ncbi:TolC family protein [uncultured Roseivirga sp.]|uniref:TolC family protein n=1 Tax=uncultured Roseivirga sp. TaxID=543088 RepID=UPI0030DA99C8
MNRLIKTILLLSVCFNFAYGQERSPIFTQDQLLWYIENYHPIAQQGKLLIDQGESSVRAARGGFDPKLFANLDQKQFDEKEYYSILNSGLKIPTWYGLEFKTGFEQNRGVYLNPENKVPNGGLWYGGVSVSLGQGLFIDQRRAELQKAKVFASSTVAEQRALMNELYFDAIKQYWKWVQAYNEYQVYEESVTLAVTRFTAVKNSYLLGDKPAIDTLEAKIQVQNRELARNEYRLAYQNATLELSNYLWFENNTPLEITDELRPPLFDEIELNNTTSFDTLQTFVNAVPSAHPDMQVYQFKLSSLEIDRKLKAEKIKPKLNLNYNFLSEPVGDSFLNNVSNQNYKWGIEFSLPIFLREQRGNLQLAKYKIENTTFGQRQKQLEIENKVLSYFNEHVALREQVEIYRNAVNNYSSLLEGERIKFNIGESSLFLVNSRESSLIEARLKAIALVSKYNISSAGINYASGRLYR